MQIAHSSHKNLHTNSHLPSGPHSPPGDLLRDRVLRRPPPPPRISGVPIFSRPPPPYWEPRDSNCNHCSRAQDVGLLPSLRPSGASPRGWSVPPTRTRGLSGLPGPGPREGEGGGTEEYAMDGHLRGGEASLSRTSLAAPPPLVPNLNRGPEET